MPGPTGTDFFERAGFNAMMEGEGNVITGWKNKLQAAFASVAPPDVTAEMHSRQAAPGTGRR